MLLLLINDFIAWLGLLFWVFIWWFDLRAYDRAAIKFRGTEADINFSVFDYDEDIKQVSEG